MQANDRCAQGVGEMHRAGIGRQQRVCASQQRKQSRQRVTPNQVDHRYVGTLQDGVANLAFEFAGAATQGDSPTAFDHCMAGDGRIPLGMPVTQAMT
ncbi:MAG: hypothetical protein BWZ07_02793 [Alphaproteobacteria bacterium ADurb.BinA280]|nr:MAG: hypothetical protein BWZ07_02793 [Alphaproteobacteria bacterium ADurb.BinA280]